ncbi:asparagine synthetase [glutamine-hydrolyzing]-like [Asterias rubens]|uniref:asparagine synthetase [glutamine-hydrolyzing]-like n=1 Tax=Asterias rubens TaxID=7604 RepID=UPI001455B89E|nr:asparagine synthetase [glutamine-hydrolyzing]-like [Asterias rubens]
MCGIWAIFGSDQNVFKQCKNSLKIAHRGPDSFRVENISHYSNCCLAFYQLAIMDDLYGMQPMRIKSHPNIYVLCNGEIYNHRTLQKQFDLQYLTESDCEILIHLYVRGGAEYAASMLDGVFAFCLLDTAARKIYLGRDTYGVRPMFRLLKDDGFLAICSEAKGLLGLDHGHEDTDSAPDFEIIPFPPGNIESYDLAPSGKVTLCERVEFHSLENKPKWSDKPSTVQPSGEDVYANIRVLVTDAVRKRLMSHRPIGCLLSGGVDSSLVAALVVKLAKESGIQYPIQTYSIGLEGSTDILAARKVAAHIGSEHHEVSFTPDEGTAVLEDVIYSLETWDTSNIRCSIAMYLVSRYIQKETDRVVIFSGEGSDELAQGYIYFHKQPSPEVGDAESRRLLKDLYLYDVLRSDRTTAAHGLEVRVPLLDHHLTSYYLSLPASMRCPQQGIEKYLLRKAFDGTGLLPPEILWRPKVAFSDGLSSAEKPWYESLQEFACQEVSDAMLEGAPKRFPFKPPRTKECYHYRQIFEKHFKGHAKWTPHRWLQKWCDSDNSYSREIRNYKTFEANQSISDNELGKIK